jgi:CDC45-like protein
MLFQRYYSGSFFWKCSAWTMYQLQQALNRESNDSLWLWILGMTDLIVHNRSGSYSFEGDMLECSNEVQRLNPHIYNR